MTIGVKFSAKTPDEDLHGLEAIRDELLDAAGEPRVVVALIRPHKSTRDFDKGGEEVPTIRFVHVEALTGPAADTARTLLAAARQERLGADTLPFEVDGKPGETEQAGPVSERVKDAWLGDGKTEA